MLRGTKVDLRISTCSGAATEAKWNRANGLDCYSCRTATRRSRIHDAQQPGSLLMVGTSMWMSMRSSSGPEILLR
jgi:hypothetical protein